MENDTMQFADAVVPALYVSLMLFLKCCLPITAFVAEVLLNSSIYLLCILPRRNNI